jgi:hypothetical protein
MSFESIVLILRILGILSCLFLFFIVWAERAHPLWLHTTIRNLFRRKRKPPQQSSEHPAQFVFVTEVPIFSRFFSKQLAEDAVNDAVLANRPAIRQWAKARIPVRQAFEFEMNSVIGEGYVKDIDQLVQLTRVRTIFKIAQTPGRKFFLFTAYPIPTLTGEPTSSVAEESKNFPGLKCLNQGYFNQDYELISEDPDEVVRVFKEENGLEYAKQTAWEIWQFLALYGSNEAELMQSLARILRPEFAFYYRMGRTAREGLEKVIEILLRPAETP